MIRWKWKLSRRLAVWFWGILALFLSADFYGRLYIFTSGQYAAENAARSEVSEVYDKTFDDTERAGSAGAIALTFDDGPHEIYTPRLLDGLKERGVRASFFLVGQNIDGKEDIVLRMQEEGHLIGNHTYSHIQLTRKNRETFKEELVKTNEVIKEITGEDVLYVRPPYGTWDKSLEEELNMFPVLWTIDPLDWCSKNASCVAGRILQKADENEIILMHDYYDTSVTAALKVVDELLEQGYEFVTVEEILLE